MVTRFLFWRQQVVGCRSHATFLKQNVFCVVYGIMRKRDNKFNEVRIGIWIFKDPEFWSENKPLDNMS